MTGQPREAHSATLRLPAARRRLHKHDIIIIEAKKRVDLQCMRAKLGRQLQFVKLHSGIKIIPLFGDDCLSPPPDQLIRGGCVDLSLRSYPSGRHTLAESPVWALKRTKLESLPRRTAAAGPDASNTQ